MPESLAPRPCIGHMPRDLSSQELRARARSLSLSLSLTHTPIAARALGEEAGNVRNPDPPGDPGGPIPPIPPIPPPPQLAIPSTPSSAIPPQRSLSSHAAVSGSGKSYACGEKMPSTCQVSIMSRMCCTSPTHSLSHTHTSTHTHTQIGLDEDTLEVSRMRSTRCASCLRANVSML